METTRVLEHGQVVLPEFIRRVHKWNVGQELIIVNIGEGVLLTSKTLFEPTTLDDVAGCLKYTGKAKTLEDMDRAIAEGVKKTYASRR
jgi:bifunctional DNA-binding transcriptional regulator/antitoxin component of YhaV-PrlF toxin-antitoxin module